VKKNGNNQETNDEDAASKRKVLRCDLKVPRLGIKSRFEAVRAGRSRRKRKISEWLEILRIQDL